MEADGFTVYEAEWWHFDYKDWEKYPIGNLRFENINSKPGSASKVIGKRGYGSAARSEAVAFALP
jgi:hypothetical protein